MRYIGTFEGKMHFSALVEAAEHGETIILTRKGRAVAQIGPVRDRQGESPSDVMDRILSRPLRIGIPTRDLIDEGRR